MNQEFSELVAYQTEILKLFDQELPLEEKRELLDQYHDYELAQTVLLLESSHLSKLPQLLSDSMLANILSQLDATDAVSILELFPIPSIPSILNAMEVDDLVDMIQAFEDHHKQMTYLSLIPTSKRHVVLNLLDYDDKVVGSIMNTTFVALQKTMTVKQAIKELVRVAPHTEFINNAYVIEDGKLIGVLSLKEMMSHGNKPETLIEDLMTVNVKVVTPLTRNETALLEMQHYDFMLLPVVDEDMQMLGVVSFDDMAEILNEESDEDYSRLAGISDVNLEEEGETVKDSVKKRMPWLAILLVINLLTSSIIAVFEDVLVAIPVLALFMPLILNMAGNSGTQSLGIIIRLFATNQLVDQKEISKHLLKETITGFLNGLIIGVLLFLVVVGLRMMDGSSFATVFPFALVISVSIFVALVVSTLAGATIPLFMKMIKVDPAVASGPFITTVNDIISLIIYFSLASIMLVEWL